MRSITSTRLRRTILPASYAIYITGLAVSTITFFHNKQFDPTTALLSDLASPVGNPHGHLALAVATVLTAILFIPATVIFHQCLQKSRLSLIATISFSAGIVAAILIAALAPITGVDSALHIQLAYAAFTGIILGTTLYLIAARASHTIITLQIVVLLFLIWEYFGLGPDLLTGTHLFNSLAFCEWTLCLDCAIALWILAIAVERHQAHAKETLSQ